MEHPTCKEIAGKFELWGEYVDPHAYTTRDEFDEMSFDERLATIHECFPNDCNCSDDD